MDSISRLHPQTPLLEVLNLGVTFRSEEGSVEAVRGVSLSLAEGETMAIVGESGSGKSVTALSLTRLLPAPPAEWSGEIRFSGENILTMGSSELRHIRGGGIAYVFQEPSSSLNPVYTVGNQIEEAIKAHRPDIRNTKEEAIKWLERVGIVNARLRFRDYPHQLSGGMQQRVVIAMALSCRPKLLVADEPTTALDVTTQAQILDLLKDLRRTERMAIILITHNFGIIRGIADRVAVMFRGKIVEDGMTETVLAAPAHPYTRALMKCVPRPGQRRSRLETIDYAELDRSASGATG